MLVEIQTDDLKLDGHTIGNSNKFLINEPTELLGDNKGPIAQDYQLGGLAGNVLTTFIAVAFGRGVKVNSLSLNIKGELNCRGDDKITPNLNPGFDKLEYKFIIGSDVPLEQLY